MSDAKTSRREQRAQAQNLSIRSGTAFPNSKRIWISGSRADIRVPMREIQLSRRTPAAAKIIRNTQKMNRYRCMTLPVPMAIPTRPSMCIRSAKLRAGWIAERNDSETISALSSSYSQQRLADDGWIICVLNTCRCRAGQSGRRVTQLHYARQGIITPEMEFIALRENMGRERIRSATLLQQHAGHGFAQLPENISAEFVRAEVASGRAIIPANINHPNQSR